MAASAVGLHSLTFQVSRSNHMSQSTERPVEIEFDRVEVLCIWIPKTLEELAKNPSRSAVTRTHKEFKRFLERQHQEGVWYALNSRAHQRDGGFIDFTHIKHPYSDLFFFPEMEQVLAATAGHPRDTPMVEFSNASIVVISDELLNRDPHQVMSEFLAIRLPRRFGNGPP